MIKRKIQIAAFLIIASCPVIYSMDAEDMDPREIAEGFGWEGGGTVLKQTQILACKLTDIISSETKKVVQELQDQLKKTQAAAEHQVDSKDEQKAEKAQCVSYEAQFKNLLQKKQLFFVVNENQTKSLFSYSRKDLKRWQIRSFSEEIKKEKPFEEIFPVEGQYENFDKTSEQWPETQTKEEINRLFEELDSNRTRAIVIELIVDKEGNVESSELKPDAADQLIQFFSSNNYTIAN